jgi:hypothetical protein
MIWTKIGVSGFGRGVDAVSEGIRRVGMPENGRNVGGMIRKGSWGRRRLKKMNARFRAETGIQGGKAAGAYQKM